MELYGFQQTALDSLGGNKHFVILPTGAGKSAVMMRWLKQTGKKHVLIVTQASKRDSGDFNEEADTWCGKEWRTSLSSFTVLSWEGLHKFVTEFGLRHLNDFREAINEYAIAFDECQRASNGVSSLMGKAFLRITYNTDCWTAYTATPGDTWIKFYPYFVACGKVKNKTRFKNTFCNIQMWKGYPEIVNYFHEDVLVKWWREISVTPDASQMFREMPSETYKTVEFKKPTGYDKFMKTRIHPQTGEFVDTIMGVCHTARQMCCSKAKLDWVKDFVSGLGTNAVIFYSYIEEGNALEEVIKKALPKGAKIWRIDGKHHDIPDKNSVGKYDIVLAQWTSGSASLNLQFAHYWVSVSPNYSYTVHTQAVGRIKRIGQKHPMFFYFLRCRDTIEEDVYKALKTKKDFSEKVWGLEKGIEDEEG